ncbi:DUF3189 family protein [Alkaliphilus peptidifermentans]|uniref:DUF3189 family protein n=1 Tax=Alkaliphilus peptidifermentans DSM 18978 TaxID=1120976 RepID=A0A1G5DT09_9FIRM|nr:DUF3189 family protein [Alkaliphilus peptidifermentans]SCY17468.1 Protein of unknown function [Alkaliphilus peptidifermentans DSM 18978]
MHIIYHCVGGAHSSVVAATIHLNRLPLDKKPTVSDLLNIPYYDTITVRDRGKIIYRGTDERGHKIYTMGRQFVPHLVVPVVEDTWKMLKGNIDDLVIVSTLSTVNFLMRLGGMTSRRFNWVSFGRPIVARGTIQTYFNIVKIVEETKKSLDTLDK